MATTDQRRRYTKGGADWIREVTSLSRDYGKLIPRQKLMSDWGTQTATITRRIQW